MDAVKRPSEKLSASVAQSVGGRMHGDAILARCYGMVHQMLEDRGITVVGQCNNTDILMQRIDDGKAVLTAQGSTGKTMVFIDPEDRTGVKLVRTLLEHDANLIIINIDGATPFTKREVSDVARIEFWQLRELLINPTRHALVPKHTALAEEEVEALHAERCMLPAQFPVLLSTDIIARWYRLRRGTVVKIDRKGLAHERGVYYRKVK